MEHIPSLTRALCTAQSLVSKLRKTGGHESLDTLYTLEEVLASTLSTVRSSINIFSPINQCPNDVLSIIFQYAVALINESAGEFQWPFSSLRSSPRLIDLTHVCRRWRVLLLDRPLLWTHIGDHLGSDPLLRAAPTFLERSREASLKLHVRVMSARQMQTISHFFESNLSRIEELHVKHTPDLFGLHHSAPALKVLTMESVQKSPGQTVFAGDVPLLRALTMQSMSWFPKNPLPSLTHLCIYSKKAPGTNHGGFQHYITSLLSGLADFLDACPGLEELIVSDAPLLVVPSTSDRPPVTLKHLRRLSIGEMPIGVLSWFLTHIKSHDELSTRIFGLRCDGPSSTLSLPNIPPLNGSTILHVGTSSPFVLVVTATDSSAAVRIECGIPRLRKLHTVPDGILPWASWPLSTITELHVTGSKCVSDFGGLPTLFRALPSLSVFTYVGGLNRLRFILSALTNALSPFATYPLPCPSLATLQICFDSESYMICEALAEFAATRARAGCPLRDVVIQCNDPVRPVRAVARSDARSALACCSVHGEYTHVLAALAVVAQELFRGEATDV
ncbi:hypothetical protein BKA93DRAFT_810638 [Sparassis latifolia]